MDKQKQLRYLSLFSGIGGFELGIQRAFDGKGARRFGQEESIFESDSTDTGSQPNERQYATCIGYSEIDKYAIKVYERNFNGHKNYGDATAINPTDLPDFDLLVGGFPCQAFSIAGKRAGFNDTRGTLFFDIARILKEKQPRHLVLENVKGLLSHDSGRTFTTIIGVLTDMGYLVEWQVLNSKNFGVPQNRERIFIVGHLRGECGRQVFPITGANKKDTRIIGQDVAYTIDANYHKGTNTLEKSRRSLIEVSARHENRVYEKVAPTVQSSYGTGGGHVPFVTEKPRIRKLTPKECERLQGFPDDWTRYGIKRVIMEQSQERPWPENGQLSELEEISDTQRYKMCGNAVTVNVVEVVMRRLYEHL